MKRGAVKSALIAVALLALASSTALANTITPKYLTGSFIPGTSITYTADVTSAELQTGDGFTIFDIGGFVSFGVTNPLWVASNSLTGSYAGLTSLGPDDPTLMNVTYTYIGPNVEILDGMIFTPFVINTTATVLGVDDWVSRDHEIGTIGPIDGPLATVHRDQIVVPFVARVPDGGSTAMLLGSMMVGFGMLRRKFHKG
jgi:hypothetical protein